MSSHYRSDADEGISAGILVGVAMVVVAAILLVGYFVLRAVFFQVDTAQQDLRRQNINHQAPLVMANNAQLHILCAAIGEAESSIASAERAQADFKDSHDIKHLSPTDRATWQDLVDNLSGARVAFADDKATYTARISNTDYQHGLDTNLPLTYSGCL